MEWVAKGEAYDEVFRSGRTAKNISKYIPKKFENAYDHTVTDCDGYWIYLNDGWRAYDHYVDCKIIHEYNIHDLKKAIKTIAYKDEWRIEV